MREWFSRFYVKIGLALMALPVSMAEASEGGDFGAALTNSLSADMPVSWDPFRASAGLAT